MLIYSYSDKKQEISAPVLGNVKHTGSISMSHGAQMAKTYRIL